MAWGFQILNMETLCVISSMSLAASGSLTRLKMLNVLVWVECRERYGCIKL